MARARSSMLIAIGLAVFVVGSALAFLALRDDDDGGNVAASNQPAAVAPAANTAAQTNQVPRFTIPDGKEAVAIQVASVPGVAGYAKAGDRVNVYGTFSKNLPNGVPKMPAAKLILKNVEVLNVTAPAAGVEGGNATYLLAVGAEDVERVVYMATFEGIHMSLVKDGAPPVGNTPGRTPANIL